MKHGAGMDAARKALASISRKASASRLGDRLPAERRQQITLTIGIGGEPEHAEHPEPDEDEED